MNVEWTFSCFAMCADNIFKKDKLNRKQITSILSRFFAIECHMCSRCIHTSLIDVTTNWQCDNFIYFSIYEILPCAAAKCQWIVYYSTLQNIWFNIKWLCSCGFACEISTFERNSCAKCDVFFHFAFNIRSLVWFSLFFSFYCSKQIDWKSTSIHMHFTAVLCPWHALYPLHSLYLSSINIYSLDAIALRHPQKNSRLPQQSH